MKIRLEIVLAILLVTSLSMGCKRRQKTAGAPDASGGGERAMLRVLPEGARPGILVTVAASQPAFPDGAKTRVELGGQPAQLVRWISPTEVEVLVPNVAAGTARMEVSGGKATSSTQFEVLPAAAQELVLKMADGKLELIAARPTGTSRTQSRRAGSHNFPTMSSLPKGRLFLPARLGTRPRRAGRSLTDPAPRRRFCAGNRRMPLRRASSHSKCRLCRAQR